MLLTTTLLVLSAQSPTLRVGMVGHSLLNHEIPQMLRTVAASKGKSIYVYEQIINGSPLSHNWKNSDKSEKHPENRYGDLRAEIARARPPFDAVVLTERVAVKDCIQWEDTQGYTVQWRNHALKANPRAQVYHYSTWVGFRNGDWWKDVPDAPTWRSRTFGDGKLYEQVVADVNRDARSAKGAPVRIVPGHLAMARLYDALEAGKLPWLGRNIRAVMSDDIHLKSVGNYYIACVMYASLFGDSPVGATGTTKGIWGHALTDLPREQAADLQRLAWQSVSEYRR